MRVAALYVEPGGPYFGRDDVDPWDEARDARRYRGPHRVIAHPPCKRWGRYWGGGPSVSVPRLLGDDGGCFASALWAARTFGGAIEHPEASHAWDWFGLPRPSRWGLWSEADRYGGRSCCVAQGHYGHRAQKLTWVYACVESYPQWKWGGADGARLDAGYHSAAERAAATPEARGARDSKRLTTAERIFTPEPFARLLLELVA